MAENAHIQLPVELLEHITSFLQDDSRTLRTLYVPSRVEVEGGKMRLISETFTKMAGGGTLT